MDVFEHNKALPQNNAADHPEYEEGAENAEEEQ